MALMLDPANELRTSADALDVGRACDEGGYFWYEATTSAAEATGSRYRLASGASSHQ